MGCQPQRSEGGERDSSPHLLSLCLGGMAKPGSGGTLLPHLEGCLAFPPHTLRDPLLEGLLPPFPTNLTSAVSLDCHGCSTITAVPVSRGRAPQGESEPRCTPCRSHLPTETGQAAVTEI